MAHLLLFFISDQAPAEQVVISFTHGVRSYVRYKNKTKMRLNARSGHGGSLKSLDLFVISFKTGVCTSIRKSK